MMGKHGMGLFLLAQHGGSEQMLTLKCTEPVRVELNLQCTSKFPLLCKHVITFDLFIELKAQELVILAK